MSTGFRGMFSADGDGLLPLRSGDIKRMELQK